MSATSTKPSPLATPQAPRGAGAPSLRLIAAILGVVVLAASAVVLVANRGGPAPEPAGSVPGSRPIPQGSAVAPSQGVASPSSPPTAGSRSQPANSAVGSARLPAGVPSAFPWQAPSDLSAVMADPTAHVGESFSWSVHMDPVGVRNFDLYGTSVGGLVSNEREADLFEQDAFAFLHPATPQAQVLLRTGAPNDFRVRVRVIGVDDSSGDSTPVVEVFRVRPMPARGSGPVAQLRRDNAQLALLLALHGRGFDVVRQLQQVVG